MRLIHLCPSSLSAHCSVHDNLVESEKMHISDAADAAEALPEFITFGRDFGHISILWIFGLILALFPM